MEADFVHFVSKNVEQNGINKKILESSTTWRTNKKLSEWNRTKKNLVELFRSFDYSTDRKTHNLSIFSVLKMCYWQNRNVVTEIRVCCHKYGILRFYKR